VTSYRQHELANGLTVVAECNPQAYTSAFGFFVKAGSRDESEEIGGVSHFLEHMVFKGTPNRTAEQVNLELDELGSNSNARTSEESTIYHAAVLPEFQSQIVELLSDTMRPSLRPEDFETEKQVIIEEIKMYADQPPYGGFERIMAEFFGGHPLGQSVLGTTETVSALTPDQMMEYFQQRYSPSNIALAASGNIDFDHLVEDAEKFCGSWERFDAPRSVRKADYQSGFVSMHQPVSSQQYILQLAPGPATNDEDRFAARLMSTIVGDDSGSRMYWEFLDSGVAESAGMGGYEFDGSGSLMTFLCCEPDRAQESLNRLLKLQRDVKSNGVTQRELELAKRKVASHIVLASERTETRMFSVGSQWLTGLPYRTAAEIAASYEAVTLAQVNEALEKWTLDTNMTLVVGPCEDLAAAV
jgi:predicted Zn-dependent peptidase